MRIIRRPLLFMRKRSLLGTFFGQHYGVGTPSMPLSKSVGGYVERSAGAGGWLTEAGDDWLTESSGNWLTEG